MASSNPAYYDQDPRDATRAAPGYSNTEHIQKELDLANKAMANNLHNLSERGERLNNLQDKTNQLSESAGHFKTGANRVRKQMWWKDMKMRMCIIIGIIVLLVVIIVPSAIYGSRH